MGRKRIEIDADEVERLAGLGLTQEEIALSLGISVGTLENRKRESGIFGDAIKRGQSKAKSDVANIIYTKAMDGDLGAAIWYEKTRSGFTDKTVQEHSGEMVITVRYEND